MILCTTDQQPDPRIPISILMTGIAQKAQPIFREIPLSEEPAAPIIGREREQAYEEPERWDGMS